MYRFKTILLVFFLGVLMSGCSEKFVSQDYKSDHFIDGKFSNSEKNMELGFTDYFGMMKDFIFYKSKESQALEDDIPVVNLTENDIKQMVNYSVVRLGHSTLLFKLENKLILTDPVFGQRTSPFSFMGPKRFHKSPIDVDDLPYIDVVIISHDHYDHLDEYTIENIKDKVGKFYTTIGVKKRLQDLGVEADNIIELDWWKSTMFGDIQLVCTPTQHFSGRWLFDKNKTLWSSWVIKAPKANIFFGADSGYFNGFKEIAWNYGPFDITFLEVGAYNKRWEAIHMMPEQSIQAHLDLKGKVMFPIHNGTFDLSLHSWREPFERVDKEGEKKGVKLLYPKMGEAISIIKENNTTKWWKK